MIACFILSIEYTLHAGYIDDPRGFVTAHYASQLPSYIEWHCRIYYLRAQTIKQRHVLYFLFPCVGRTEIQRLAKLVNMS